MYIKLVVATRESFYDFFDKTATGRSLIINKPPFVDLHLFANNKKGLPEIYNQVISECKNTPATLIFCHDDLHILDFFWFYKIKEGLLNFNAIGLVGNKRRLPGQPSWAFTDTNFTWDDKQNFSGVVAHGKEFPPDQVDFFGRPRQKVKLLDGLFLAVESQTLIDNDIRFDPRFDFHFYDMDFCRQFENKNLSCGTLDLSIIHQSGGGYDQKWLDAYSVYINKWGE